MSKWKDNSYKLNLISDIQNLLKSYSKLVEKMGDIFLSISERKKIEEEIKIVESLIKSKINICSEMKGY